MLNIKPAAEYAAAEAVNAAAKEANLTEMATNFINNEVTPKIEDMIAYPEKYTTKGSAVFKVPSYPATAFVNEVAGLLKPLGYIVKESHDGAGIYATVVISWEKYVISRKK